LSHFFAHLQSLVAFVTAGLLLMLIAVASYPFQPRELMLLFNWTIVLSVVGLILLTFIQMERSTILSLLSGSTPGQVSWNREFVLRLAIYGVLPIMTLLSAQFPDTLRRIVSWIGMLQGHS
jgi:hypothetical protein